MKVNFLIYIAFIAVNNLKNMNHRFRKHGFILLLEILVSRQILGVINLILIIMAVVGSVEKLKFLNVKSLAVYTAVTLVTYFAYVSVRFV